MVLLSNMAAQTLQPGQAVTFDLLKMKNGNGECWNRQINKLVKLRGNGVWKLSFAGNVTSDTAGANTQMAIAVAGEPLVETAMNRTIPTAGTVENIATLTAYKVCCCDLNQVSVINTGAVPVTLAPNSAFLVERKCG